MRGNRRTDFLIGPAMVVFLLAGAGKASAIDPANTMFGNSALISVTSGNFNSAFGESALLSDTTGSDNTAVGLAALQDGTDGNLNTAVGVFALTSNDASGNTATGAYSLEDNNSGGQNTADGSDALTDNQTGSANTAMGATALFSNLSGIDDTATGAQALQTNTASFNTADGFNALFANTSGSHNTADGMQALLHNTSGSFNTAAGLNALAYNTIGNYNIGLGLNAGLAITKGSYNIEIGSGGAGGDTNTIRVGTQGTQKATYVAGISGSAVTGTAVVVSSAGKLGILMSSARYKRDIRDMGNRSSKLMKLRPVTFRYRNDPAGAPQYGLVAEEVARVYPELVTYGADGRIETVKYLTLSAMLLNELQKQAAENRSQAVALQRQRRELSQQAARIETLTAQRAAFDRRLATLEHAMIASSGNQTVAAAASKP